MNSIVLEHVDEGWLVELAMYVRCELFSVLFAEDKNVSCSVIGYLCSSQSASFGSGYETCCKRVGMHCKGDGMAANYVLTVVAISACGAVGLLRVLR